MKDINLFSGEKRWLKGNLHCHTNVSDGKRFPQEKAKIYKKLDITSSRLRIIIFLMQNPSGKRRIFSCCLELNLILSSKTVPAATIS